MSKSFIYRARYVLVGSQARVFTADSPLPVKARDRVVS